MERLIHSDFILETDEARRLYHEFAEGRPIIDYHCHLSPREIAEDQRWENLTQIWLYGDHYKWRVMRSNGIDEKFITGDAADREKFNRWAETMPRLLRNPLYHWTHLELARYFDVFDLLSPATADAIWERGAEVLSQPEMSARGLVRASGVRVICTTDDPTDSLDYHAALAADSSFETKVLPTWRPDKAYAVEAPDAFNGWVDRLGEQADIDISTWDNYLEALLNRHAFFTDHGCKLADHGIATFYAAETAETDAVRLFQKVRGGNPLTADETFAFKSAVLHELCLLNHSAGWTQQFHFGAMRNNNSRFFEKLGPDAGFDSMGDLSHGLNMSRFLDRLDRTDQLAPTILYNIHPKDNALVASMLGNFQDGSMPGKMQMGSGWWFLDQMDGMQRQIEDLSQMGLLSRFVGMLTDSRSFLSYTRHEYFRRILCNVLGSDMARGLIPRDFDLVGGMVDDICWRNAERYFTF